MKLRHTLLWVFLTIVVVTSIRASSPLAAQELYIGNQPFYGGATIEGGRYLIDLKDVALMLGYRLGHFDGAWSIEGAPLQTEDRQGRPWILLDELPSSLVHVVESPSLGVLDLYRVREEADRRSTSGSWGGEITLLYFHATWCPVSQSMTQTIRAIEQSRALRLVHVGIDEEGSPAFNDYARYFEGDRIPFYVILDRRGRKLDAFFGFQTYNELRERMERAARPE